MDNLIDGLKAFYGNFAQADLTQMEDLYDPSVEFSDPVHHLSGLTSLQAYFDRSRAGLRVCEFEFTGTVISGDQCFMPWKMHYSHEKLRGGERMTLPGVSHFQFEDKVIIHRDYYDLGKMLYEHVPVLGWAVRSLKERL